MANPANSNCTENPSKAIATLTIRGKHNYHYVVSSILVVKSQQYHWDVVTDKADRCRRKLFELNFFILSIKCTRNCVKRQT